jgi:hypothetical protein
MGAAMRDLIKALKHSDGASIFGNAPSTESQAMTPWSVFRTMQRHGDIKFGTIRE